MRADRKLLVLGMTLAGALPVLIAGCSREGPVPAPVASTSVGTEIDDSLLTMKVKSALLADPDIKSFDIAVATRKGAVQLSGFVDSQMQIDQAIALARKVDGVTSIDSEMSIKK